METIVADNTPREKKKGPPRHHRGQQYKSGGEQHQNSCAKKTPYKKEGKPRNQKPQTPKPTKYEPYWNRKQVEEGLKRGDLIQGPLRVNPKNHQDAYIPHPDGHSDVYICGLVDRNRAFSTDIVAVQIFPVKQWKVLAECPVNESKSLPTAAAAAAAASSASPAEEASVGSAATVPDPSVQSSAAHSDTSSKSEQDHLVESVEKLLLELKHPPTANMKQAKSGKAIKSDKASPRTPNGVNHKKIDAGKSGGKKQYRSVGDVLSEETDSQTRSAVQRLFGDEACDKGRQVAMSDDVLRTGKVVYIIEKKHSMACTGIIKHLSDKNPNWALFSPVDSRMPRIQVPMADCPPDFKDRPDIYVNNLFIARITEWHDNSNFPRGRLARSLGEAGMIEPETEGILIENGIDFEEFSKEVLDCLPQNLPWRIPTKELEQRKDLRQECIFTIDPATARDLDDALHCNHLGDGIYEVGVHIADVTYFVHEGTELDRVAGDRATSVYLVQKVIPMLPRLLCEELCSLNPDTDRLTFSVIWTITEEGHILDEWFGRSVIRSCAKLSYDHAQGFIEEPTRDWTVEELPPISKGFNVEDIKQRVLHLDKIAKNLRKKRFDEGALRLDQVKLQFSLDKESGLPNGYSVYKQRDSNRLVEEFMLLANMAVAHQIYKAFPSLAVLRRHPPPQTRMINDLVAVCNSLGIPIDASSSGALQRSIAAQTGEHLDNQARMQILTALCSKPMQLAVYFCTGCLEDEALYRHYALNVPLYTHFTSPIRRYADVMVHRCLAASLRYTAPPEKLKEEVMAQCQQCNDKKASAKRVQELSSEMFFAVFVKECGPLEETGMVMAVLDQSFDVLVLRLGVTKRVYVENLPLANYAYRKNHKRPELTLTWSADDDHPREVVQMITIFSRVRCCLSEGDKPLKWNAVVKHPEDYSDAN